MKLSNHGWSINQMILCCSVLLIAFFFVVFFAMQLQKQFGDSFKESITGKVTYATIERNISVGSLAYIEEYYDNDVGNGTITITTDNLIEYAIIDDEDLITSEKDSCKGYALIRKNKDTSLYSEAFITCQDYTTKDFQHWRMGD